MRVQLASPLFFFFFFLQGAKRKVPAVGSDLLLVPTPALLPQLFHSRYSLIIFSLFSLTPFPILLSHSVFAVCWNSPLGTFWQLHTKDNKNN